MIALLSIIALYLEPVGSITDEPWDYVAPLEFIEMGPTVDDMILNLQRPIEPQECAE